MKSANKIVWFMGSLVAMVLCLSLPVHAATLSTTQSKTEYCNVTTSGSTLTFKGKVDVSTTDVNSGKFTVIQYSQDDTGVLVGSGKPQTLTITDGVFNVTQDLKKLFTEVTSGYYGLKVDLPEGHKSYEVYFQYNNGKLKTYAADSQKTDELAYKFLKKLSKTNTSQPSYLNTATINTPSDLSMTQAEYNTIKDQATSVAAGYAGNYDRAKAIYQWVTQNIYYNQDVIGTTSNGNNNSYAVLKNRYAVCEGYSRLLVDMLTSQGIPSVYCLGLASESPITSKTGTSHGWVAVYAEGRWFFCDPTWDSANTYSSGRFKMADSSLIYFDMSLESISMTHRLQSIESKGVVNGFEVVFVDGQLAVLPYQKKKSVITLPKKFKGLTITAISCAKFSRSFNRSVKRIIIPDNYTTISNYGFRHFPNLRKLYVPKTVISVGGNFIPSSVGKTYIYCTKNSEMYYYAKKRYLKTRIISKVTLKSSVKSLKKGKTTSLKVTLNNNGSSEDITWTTSDKKIATVSSSGKVTGKKKGKVYITATVKGSSVKKKIKLKIKK